jgi:1,4-alpha-glucan branching enzyme
MYVEPNGKDLYLFGNGILYEAYRIFGAHPVSEDGKQGVQFMVYAPNAASVSVVGDFNQWDADKHPMRPSRDSGTWRIFVPDLHQGAKYKYAIRSEAGELLYKVDPYAFHAEIRPNTASVVYDLSGYNWQDADWQLSRSTDEGKYGDKGPMNIYEMHLGSWKHHNDGTFYSYRDLAEELPIYIKEMGYTHVEFLPLMEHPFDGSWGYQITGYYAATSRYGSPKDLMYLIDRLHQSNIGVIMDWVPVHFCKDAHGLSYFDGGPVYEFQDPVRAEQSNWGTGSFDLGKNQVKSFLISNVLFWLEIFHVDSIRVDAVASMLYLDFERSNEQWSTNRYGGRENIEGIDFLRHLNLVVRERCPAARMIAEESSAWPHVSKNVEEGGLGFHYKWNMGWMNDTLQYMKKDTPYRKNHHNLLTFSFFYAFTEQFVLPLSHDEVVHGKKSLVNKMPGDYWQKFANLRVFLGYMMTHPGKKLSFMGAEFAQFIEWDEGRPLDWFLLDYPAHSEAYHYTKALNHLYLENPSLWERDEEMGGFQWIEANDYSQSIISFIRYDADKNPLIIICNFTPVVHEDYRIGIPLDVGYQEIFNTDKPEYGGSGVVNTEVLTREQISWHNFSQSLRLRVPPLGMVVLAPVCKKG